MTMGAGGVMFLLVFRLGIPGAYGIVILFPSLPLVPSSGPFVSFPSATCSFT